MIYSADYFFKIGKYLDPVDNESYTIKKDIEIPADIMVELREFDEHNVICYGRHCIKDFSDKSVSEILREFEQQDIMRLLQERLPGFNYNEDI